MTAEWKRINVIFSICPTYGKLQGIPLYVRVVPAILSRPGSGFSIWRGRLRISTQCILHEGLSFFLVWAKKFRKNYTLCNFLEATVKNLKLGFSLFHCYCIPPPGCMLTKAYQSLCSGNDMTGAKKFEKGPCSTKKSKNDSVPPKFEKRPCSTKIWQATMLHQKIWKATMLHRKIDDRVPPKCDKWPQILVEHCHFSS